MKIIIVFLVSLSVLAQEKMTFFANLKEIPDYYTQFSNENMVKTLIGEPWQLGLSTVFKSSASNGLRASNLILTEGESKVFFRIYSLEPHVRSINSDLNYVLHGQGIPTLDDQKYDQQIKNIQGYDFIMYKGDKPEVDLDVRFTKKCIYEYIPEKFISLRFVFDCSQSSRMESIINQFNLKRFIDKIITSP